MIFSKLYEHPVICYGNFFIGWPDSVSVPMIIWKSIIDFHDKFDHNVFPHSANRMQNIWIFAFAKMFSSNIKLLIVCRRTIRFHSHFSLKHKIQHKTFSFFCNVTKFIPSRQSQPTVNGSIRVIAWRFTI